MEEKIKKKIETFFLQFPRVKMQKGDAIKVDKTSSEAFYLKKGHVREYTFSPQGVELTLHVFAPGSFFPMTEVLAGIKNRYYYEALTSVELYETPKEKVIKLLRQEPEIMADLSRRLLLGLDKLLMRIEYLTFGRAETKVVATLLFISRHFGVKKGDEVELNQPFTHRDIAAFAGISRETASRELEKLQRRKLLRYSNRRIVLKDHLIFRKQLDEEKS
ncbi:Crp/Fnr family transcriptional regulator [Candidatus Roizmanbacteria bacterium]|nr:Crp/Fnr family transcriptional regulator [Candidatus Roizmanbacteria bacterium]